MRAMFGLRRSDTRSNETIPNPTGVRDPCIRLRLFLSRSGALGKG